MKNTDQNTDLLSRRTSRRLARTVALLLALAGVSQPSLLSAAISVSPDDPGITSSGDGHYTWNYSAFDYTNLSSIWSTATIAGLDNTVRQSGSNYTAGSSRWFTANALTGSVTYTFDFSATGYTVETITVNTDSFRTFGGYTGSTTRLYGEISVNGSGNWIQIYTFGPFDNASWVSIDQSSLLGSLVLGELEDGAPVTSVSYRWRFDATGSPNGAHVAYMLSRYNDIAAGRSGLDIDFTLAATAPIPEPSAAAAGFGFATLVIAAGLRLLRRKR
ncbi:MAG: hypothetical protein LBK99_13250 [Opitutaceae bacterium]|jgi:hypothetical protein|nr:hypothetical protein [Opitutaceae bacterium]